MTDIAYINNRIRELECRRRITTLVLINRVDILTKEDNTRLSNQCDMINDQLKQLVKIKQGT